MDKSSSDNVERQYIKTVTRAPFRGDTVYGLHMEGRRAEPATIIPEELAGLIFVDCGRGRSRRWGSRG